MAVLYQPTIPLFVDSGSNLSTYPSKSVPSSTRSYVSLRRKEREAQNCFERLSVPNQVITQPSPGESRERINQAKYFAGSTFHS